MASSSNRPSSPNGLRGGLRRRAGAALTALALLATATLPAAAAPPACAGTLYLTIDTGSMVSAERIAAILKARSLRATFFIAAEPTYDGGTPLDARWRDYWRARVAEGHAFGSHTQRHWYLRADRAGGILYRSAEGRSELLNEAAFCRELGSVGKSFEAMTGRPFDPLWRAPGGHTTPKSLQWATGCGFTRHAGWSKAGFLGDELPSDAYPNEVLLRRALADIRDGDVLMMHLGIRSRKDPFVNVLEPLLDGLTARGFCFATLPEKRS